MATILIALSGGVDSSVAAVLLKEVGFDVVAAHIICWERCEQGEERRDALRVALKLNIPFLTLDLRVGYKNRVFEPMLREYARGQTPNPDILCNREIKFGLLLKKALELGANHIATGHYARLKATDGGYELWEGVDKEKDQSYFRWALNHSQLQHRLFPLGDYTKRQVREIARRRGSVVSSDGRVIGEHDGIAFYTIGQRHGLGIGGGIPYYVAAKDVTTNTLFVGQGLEDPALYKKEIRMAEPNWLSSFQEGRCEIRIRYRQPKVSARVTREEGGVRIRFDIPQRGVAPGQAAVLYSQERGPRRRDHLVTPGPGIFKAHGMRVGGQVMRSRGPAQ